MKIKNNIQGSEEWLQDRVGHLTASQAQCIATGGKGLETYCYSILAEKYSNNRENYCSADMQRGNELEAMARDTYEIEREKVEQVGFCEQDELVGCSPDGLVGKNGGIEIKAPNNTNYFKILVNKERSIESKYLWQCKMCMLITIREWWDLVFYNPNFDRSMTTFRIGLDNPSREKLLLGIEKGKKLLVEIEEKFNQQK
jgi:hypothetical protein